MAHKDTQPLVTIGIPFYNAEKYLPYAITSVMNQSYKNWELILMDDGSKDGSLNIAKEFEKTDLRIKVYSNGKNLGLPSRLNELSKLASGKYYARMDADDIMHPDRILTQVNHLVNNPKIDLLATGLVSIDNENNIIGIRKGIEKTKFTLSDLLNYGGWGAHPTIMEKTIWFKKNKYDVKLTRTEDIDLWIRTINQSYFSKISDIGLYYREESTPTLKKYLFSTRQSISLYKKHKKTLGLYYFLKSIALRLIKASFYIIFSTLGITNILIKNRSNKMQQEDLQEHKKIISDITE